MKRFLRIACTVLALLAPGHAVAEGEPDCPAKPMLWKVEGQALTKPSFLFGTIHLGNKQVVTLHPAAARAFADADIVYTEIPLDPASRKAIAAAGRRTDGKKISDSIGPELARQLDAEMSRIRPGLDARFLQPLKTWTVALALPELRFQLAGETPLDNVLWDRAVAAGKQTAALEKPTDSVQIFDSLSEEEQVILLSETLLKMERDRNAGRDTVEDLITAYVAGDAGALRAQIDRQLSEMPDGPHKKLAEQVLQRILYDRNVSMGDAIDGILAAKPGLSHFFAVGTGHYVSATSIVDLLSAKGYRVTRLTE